MKRCPKCNRTFPDENQKFCTFDGGLLISPTTFDPNITIRATATELEVHTSERDKASSHDPGNDRPASSQKPFNPDETMAITPATVFFPRPTGPTGSATSTDLPPTPPPPVPARTINVAPTPRALPLGVTTARPTPTPRKKSKLPWIIAGILLLLLLGGASLAAVFFFVIKPRLDEFTQSRVTTEAPARNTRDTPNANSESKPAEATKTEPDTFVPPADATRFTNSKANLDGKLAEHYVDFSFYYPQSWQTDPKAGVPGASNFVQILKTVKDEKGVEVTPESVAVAWYNSNGTYDGDISIFPARVTALGTQLSKSLPNYKKVAEGPTMVNSLKAYDFHFTGVFKDAGEELPYWGRVIFIPPGKESEKNGVTIIMLVTARGTDVHNEKEVGVKGEMPLVLESFRFNRN